MEGTYSKSRPEAFALRDGPVHALSFLLWRVDKGYFVWYFGVLFESPNKKKSFYRQPQFTSVI